MYIPELHNRAARRAVVVGQRLPSVQEAVAQVFSEWPTASPARREELAEALAIIAHNEPPPPATLPRPARTLSELQAEWCAAPPEARRIFNGNFSEFLNAVPWRR